ncbi:YrbL family protein [uncultured Parasutterella sp.]|uniref:YrbL family protein n=1 Tax=uncultured Parasutterella sp. TaxID=1263098 RepID=UPI0025B6F694|nr:YrbL family protein [uncultured Parasutterella sp.]
MLTTTNEEFRKIRGRVISSGAERECVRHKSKPGVCLKISRKEKAKETRREIAYYRFLEKHKIFSKFIPVFYGAYETEDLVIIEQELIEDNPDLGVCGRRVEEFIGQATEAQIEQLENLFELLYNEMVKKNIVISDMHPGNMMVYYDASSGELQRLVVVDGLGSPEAIPLPKYFSFFGRKKIARQWEKFKKNYQATWKRQRSGVPPLKF